MTSFPVAACLEVTGGSHRCRQRRRRFRCRDSARRLRERSAGRQVALKVRRCRVVRKRVQGVPETPERCTFGSHSFYLGSATFDGQTLATLLSRRKVASRHLGVWLATPFNGEPGGLGETTAVPSEHAARPEAVSSVAPRQESLGAPCVLASERPSHPDDERRSAKPSYERRKARTASTRRWSSGAGGSRSFPKMLVMCFSTARGVMKSRSPIA
jgi:hypothetical protein